MKKILFLGYGKKSTRLIDEIKFYKKNYHIRQTSKKVDLKLVFDPPWTPDMMSEAAKVELNMG